MTFFVGGVYLADAFMSICRLWKNRAQTSPAPATCDYCHPAVRLADHEKDRELWLGDDFLEEWKQAYLLDDWSTMVRLLRRADRYLFDLYHELPATGDGESIQR